MKFGFATLNPTTYHSLSGEYSLLVDPQDPSGAGGAHYRLSRRRTVVWQGTRPFTLWQAAVTDSGTVGGYAYSFGEEGFGPQKSCATRDYGDFAIFLIDPSGRERLCRKIKRESGHYEDQSPQPQAAGILIDGTQEHLVVRIGDPDVNRAAEEWWVYALTTGREVRRLKPKEAMSSFEPARYIIDARPIAGTPLVLQHWWCFGRPVGLAARFTLIDLKMPSAKPIWILDLPHDYSIPSNDKAQDKLMQEIWRKGAILDYSRSRQFTVRFVAQKLRVTFHTIPEQGGSWRVAKTQSVPYVAPTPNTGPHVPEIRLTLRDRLDLLATSANSPQLPNPIDHPDCVITAGTGQLAFVRQGEKPALLVVTTGGQVLHEVSLENLRAGQASTAPLSLKMVWQGATRFILFCEHSDEDREKAYTKVYRVDALTGVIHLLTDFHLPPIKAIDSFPSSTEREGFVALVSVRAKYTEKSEVYAYDGNGKRIWALTRDFGYAPNEGPEMLFAPESLTVLQDGSVAVLDNIRNTVQFYDRTGRYLRTLALESTWKRTPSYPSEICSDPNGGFLVHDFSGTPSVVWMKADGNIARSFTPLDTNGKPIDLRDFAIASDDRLWVGDGYSLLGLDSAGQATARLGDAPDAQRLGSIAEVALQTGNPFGERILVRDERTAAVHVLDAHGRRLHICLPRKGAAGASASSRYGEPSIDLGPNGTFCIDEDWFGADGKLRAKPAGYRRASDRASALRRRPDGSWLGMRDQSVAAPNGALAILDSPMVEISQQPDDVTLYYVSLYSATNAPEQTISVPRLLGWPVTLAYDGRHVILAGNGWVYCYRANGQPLWRFALPVQAGHTRKQDADLEWTPFLANAGRTLCLFDGVRNLWRFAMP